MADGTAPLTLSSGLQRSLQELAGPGLAPTTVAGRAELEVLLGRVARHMLLHQTEALMQLLYRLDVDEAAAMEALQRRGLEAQSQQLAHLMLERELQRQYWRARYQQGGGA